MKGGGEGLLEKSKLNDKVHLHHYKISYANIKILNLHLKKSNFRRAKSRFNEIGILS